MSKGDAAKDVEEMEFGEPGLQERWRVADAMMERLLEGGRGGGMSLESLAVATGMRRQTLYEVERRALRKLRALVEVEMESGELRRLRRGA